MTRLDAPDAPEAGVSVGASPVDPADSSSAGTATPSRRQAKPVPDWPARTIDADADRPPDSIRPEASPGHDRPWANSGFWILQLVVLALSLVRLAATVAFHLEATSLVLEISTLGLFLVPVVVAALNYGRTGALFTGGWMTALAVPHIVTTFHDHQPATAYAELLQVALLDVLALVIGQRVSAERAARRLAEQSGEAHLHAEAMYRDLFDSNQAPILIIDSDGFVVKTNEAARQAFARERASSAGTLVRLVDMIGPEASARILTQLITWRTDGAELDRNSSDRGEPIEPIPFDTDVERVLYRPTGTPLATADGQRRMQVVFEDVTAETRRHELSEAYAERVVLGQEEERRRLAQELHDGPLQTLIHLCRQIDELAVASSTAAPAATAAAPAAAPTPLLELRSIVEGTVGELRAIAKGLRPSILDDLGLVASINQMLADVGERNLVAVSFGVTGPERRLPPPVELALFRIAQEALSNVERHAAARRVAVGMDFETGGVRLLVKDDGVGFDAADRPSATSSSSLGLSGMTERAHLVGARLVIHSSPGTGTAVDVWVPTTVIDA